MTKRRELDTIEGAIDAAVGLVGIERVAGIIGKSTDMVRKFADPDNETHHLQLRQALAIDRDLALNGYPQPFAELVAQKAARNATSEQQLAQALAEHQQRPLQAAADAVCTASRLVADIEKAEADHVYTPDEVHRLRREIRALQRKLPAIERGIVAKRAR